MPIPLSRLTKVNGNVSLNDDYHYSYSVVYPIEDMEFDNTTNLSEEQIEAEIVSSTEIDATEKEQLVQARRGQGRFRQNLRTFEHGCRITGVTDARFLIASHIKPWRSSTNEERLDGENGLLLSPTIDFLFDRGFISFSDDGTLLVSPVADEQVWTTWRANRPTAQLWGVYREPATIPFLSPSKRAPGGGQEWLRPHCF